jgi:hypothetical protein
MSDFACLIYLTGIIYPVPYSTEVYEYPYCYILQETTKGKINQAVRLRLKLKRGSTWRVTVTSLTVTLQLQLMLTVTATRKER